MRRDTLWGNGCRDTTPVEIAELCLAVAHRVLDAVETGRKIGLDFIHATNHRVGEGDELWARIRALRARLGVPPNEELFPERLIDSLVDAAYRAPWRDDA
jgi:hypothetical protein